MLRVQVSGAAFGRRGSIDCYADGRDCPAEGDRRRGRLKKSTSLQSVPRSMRGSLQSVIVISSALQGDLFSHIETFVFTAQEADKEEAEALQEQLCSALCCLAEARMGMVGDIEEVAADCEELLRRAARAEPSSPEPMQVTVFPSWA